MTMNPSNFPPRIARRMLSRLRRYANIHFIHSDLEDEFQLFAERRGKLLASFWYWGQVLFAFWSTLKQSVTFGGVMLKNYLRVAFRVILKHKGFSFIKIFGLAIGMACCLLILMYVRFEFSFDGFHTNGDRICRVLSELELSEGTQVVTCTALPVAPALRSDFSEVEKAARVSDGGQRFFRVGTAKFSEDLYYADEEFFDILTFPLLLGDPRAALSEPYSLVLPEETAQKYFGTENPLGKTITIQDVHDFTVTGVMENIPENSHLRFTALASFSSRNNEERVKGQYWDRFSNDYTYLLLSEGTDPGQLEKGFSPFMAKHIPVEEDRYRLLLQPLSDIHFSSWAFDIARTTDKNYLFAYSAIALFILFIACINFMNLATARSSGRSKEVGVRKVLGAHRSQLIQQFFTESVSLSLVSLAAALGLVALGLPLFNRFVRRELTLDVFGDAGMLLGLLVLSLFVGFVSGSYPALFLSAFKPSRVLRKAGGKTAGGLSFRSVSSVLQFSVSFVLIFATAVVYAQIGHMKKKDLGFDAEQLVVFPLKSPALKEKTETFKNVLLQHPSIRSASASFGTPASGTASSRSYVPEDDPAGESLNMESLFVDADFIKTFGLEVVAGRDFSREYATDIDQAFILNETAAKRLGWDDPIGKRFRQDDTELGGTIIGVVKDFHYDPIRYGISPMVLSMRPFQLNYMSLRIDREDVSQTLGFIQEKYREFVPEYPFSSFFVDSEFDRFYNFERRQGRLFTSCAVLAVLISCMGIFGLASYSAERRRKEVGIRKFLGASVSGITFLLSKEMVKWVLAANIIGWPVAYLVMRSWLQEFAYRVNIGIWMFVLSAFLVLVIAVLTVGYQSLKSALADPVVSLKVE